VLARDLALASTSTHQNFAAKKSFKCAVMLHTKRKEHCVVRSPYFYPFVSVLQMSSTGHQSKI